MTSAAAKPSGNPLLAQWDTPFAAPPFAQISRRSISRRLSRRRWGSTGGEVDAIRDHATVPDFDNTIAAMERAGERLKRTAGVFFNLSGAHTNPEIQKIEREIAPKLSRHSSAIYLDPKAVFARIAAVHEARHENGLTPEQDRAWSSAIISASPAPARNLGEARARRGWRKSRSVFAELGTAFSQNVLADESGFTLVLEGAADLAGLPDFLIPGRRPALRAIATWGRGGM